MPGNRGKSKRLLGFLAATRPSSGRGLSHTHGQLSRPATSDLALAHQPVAPGPPIERMSRIAKRLCQVATEWSIAPHLATAPVKDGILVDGQMIASIISVRHESEFAGWSAFGPDLSRVALIPTLGGRRLAR